MATIYGEGDFKSCSGSTSFARQMAAAGPFPDYQSAVLAARDICLNKVDVNGWLESFAAHPEIGATSKAIPKWSQEEQSTALSTATDSIFHELVEWNARYKEKFGFIFIVCASGRGMPEILAELKKRYSNRPIVELENAAQEEMKIIEIRLSKLFEPKINTNPSSRGTRSRPPITTHVLDVSKGSPTAGIEVNLEIWRGAEKFPSIQSSGIGGWLGVGSSVTDSDGRSGALMEIIDEIKPGFYRISFNTGKYDPSGFFPYVSIVFEVKQSQRAEHFHVPLLLSPFSFSTYRGS